VLNHRDPRHPRAGGSEVVLWEVCRRLSRLGVGVTWLAERFPSSQEDETFGSILIKRRGDPLSLHFFSLVEARRHEVVLDSVAHAVPFFSYLVNPYSAALVHHVHQDVLDLELGRFQASLLKRLERMVSRYPFLVAISKTTKKELVSRFNVSSERIRVIHNGLDHNFYRPQFQSKTKKPTILWLGRLKRYKNPLDAPRIFSLLSPDIRSNAKLVVAGRGDLERETREAVKEVGGVFVCFLYL
jgi:glycosyltransferase involved in cell wall biosynthesis